MPLPLRLLRGAAGGRQIVHPPADLGWTPPVTVYYEAGVGYSTSYDDQNFMVESTADLYVSPGGNDSTGTGSQAQPFRSIRQAILSANALPDAGVTVYVAAGEYPWNNHFSATSPTKPMNFIATGGRAVCSNRFAVASWVFEGSGTYRATRSGTQAVFDALYPDTMPDGFQIPSRLTQVADLAACQALPGSWALVGSALYVHAVDDRAPDATATGTILVMVSPVGMLYTHPGGAVYLKGFDLALTTYAFYVYAASGEAVQRAVFDDCRVWHQFQNAQKSFNCLSVSEVIYKNCRSYRSEGDAFSVSIWSAGRPESNCVEIDCQAYFSGFPATAANIINGSTAHSNNRYVRVNGLYRSAYGPVVQDVGSARSWALGTSARDCLLGIGANSQDACWSAGTASGNTVQMWLDGCDFGGAFYDIYAGAGCQVSYARMPAPTSSAGTVVPYTP